jgi:hypothetical protein
MSNPSLAPDVREALVGKLMDARRAISAAIHHRDDKALREARKAVDQAKRALGERGTVWWSDGAPDVNRRFARNTPYAQWFAALTAPPGGLLKGHH